MRAESIGLQCPRCAKRWTNPIAVHPIDGFISIYQTISPRLCDDCKQDDMNKLLLEMSRSPAIDTESIRREFGIPIRPHHPSKILRTPEVDK